MAALIGGVGYLCRAELDWVAQCWGCDRSGGHAAELCPRAAAASACSIASRTGFSTDGAAWARAVGERLVWAWQPCAPEPAWQQGIGGFSDLCTNSEVRPRTAPEEVTAACICWAACTCGWDSTRCGGLRQHEQDVCPQEVAHPAFTGISSVHSQLAGQLSGVTQQGDLSQIR